MTETPRIAKILFATDLSLNAERAFAYALSLADAYGAEVTVLHVFGKLPPNADLLLVSFLGYGSIEEMHAKSRGQLMERTRERITRFCAEAAGVTSTCRVMRDRVIVETGKASERILHHAHSGGYDILVMGTRGHGLIQEALLGGTSRKVIQDCAIPVFLVPMGNGR
ncbi:universal stress protein [Desulfatitalea alkaliphila]|uniref:Universal stress protein n=1 Tax=Desulfatitalea alkaliphila TaxID=2929485 RepID=A0AA41UJ08_9BACT|nr:universal stress protein [Desulfatitalea alkaliphila]MCJ8501345.1 universal stress protein [Desulfatitalea alkaliphila]